MNTNQDIRKKEQLSAPEDGWTEFGEWGDEVRLAQVRKNRPKVDVDAQWKRFEREQLSGGAEKGARRPMRYAGWGGAVAACLDRKSVV